MILFWIQIHQKTDNFLFLFERIYDVKHHYVISIDGASPFVAKPLPDNVTLRRSKPLTWGGASQVSAIIEMMEVSVQLASQWQFIINLSADDLPLKTSEDIFKFLRNADYAKFDAFLDIYGARSLAPIDFRIWADQPEADESFLLETVTEGRVPTLISPAAAAMFAQADLNPIMNFRTRPLYHCYDVIGAKRFVIRKPQSWEIKYRNKFIKKYGFMGGRSWFILSKRIVELMLSDNFLSDLLFFLQNVICSDELIVQTWVAANQSRYDLVLSDRNMRFKNGSPEYIADHILSEVLETDSFFARKNVEGKSVALKQAIKQRLPANNIDFLQYKES